MPLNFHITQQLQPQSTNYLFHQLQSRTGPTYATQSLLCLTFEGLWERETSQLALKMYLFFKKLFGSHAK